jgi:hypothetical protein
MGRNSEQAAATRRRETALVELHSLRDAGGFLEDVVRARSNASFRPMFDHFYNVSDEWELIDLQGKREGTRFSHSPPLGARRGAAASNPF